MSQQDLFPFEAPEPAEMKDVGKGKAMSKAEQAKLMDLEEPTAKDKERAAKEKADRKALKEEAEAKKAEDIKRSNLAQRPMISPKGNVFKGAMSGGAGGAGGIEMEGKMGKNTKPKMKAGGKVRSASARADGCCVRGKTRA